jgi:hypothetical protein
MRNAILALVAVASVATTSQAQQESSAITDKVVTGQAHSSIYVMQREASADQSPQAVFDKVKVLEPGIAIEMRITKNAPYSGEATTESVQVLPDGNRIMHRNATRVYRDSAGRTRRETLDAGGQVTTVAISDPSTGESFVFDPKGGKVSRSIVTRTKTRAEGVPIAYEGDTLVVTTDGQPGVTQDVTSHVVLTRQGEGAFVGRVASGDAKTPVSKEDLGQQTVEGLTANGMRLTTIIPAGAIGNEQSIKVVSEEWTSPDLQVLVLTRHSDPRTGDTTYRLSNVVRGEQARSLFDPPVPPPPAPVK